MAFDKEMLDRKIADAKKIVRQAFEKGPIEDLRITWTGGKDSTLTLSLIRQVCEEDGRAVPACFCIDEGDMFSEIQEFLKQRSEEWGVRLDMVHNDDVSRAAGGALGAEVRVADLDETNRAEIERLGYEEETFDYEPESYVGNHLMKTVAMNGYLKDNHVRGVFIGIRWDEQGARAEETYFSPREASGSAPAHERINPILHFTERDVWNATFELDLPFCELYKQGYRSLGARVTTKKQADLPAWEQDLENTLERGGRRQDKEAIMGKLRDLGYM
jgi:phosphoadenosine phosphosulfate reductase